MDLIKISTMPKNVEKKGILKDPGILYPHKIINLSTSYQQNVDKLIKKCNIL